MRFVRGFVAAVLSLVVLSGYTGPAGGDNYPGSSDLSRQERPNILLLVSEDNSPETIGAYGDSAARTPNIDRLAENGVVYQHAISNAPVCAVARSTLISGMHAPSAGLHLMRSRIAVPEFIESTFYPRLLQQAGYYTTNNAKTDYNVPGPHERFWDESSNEAHYDNREPDQPFLAVFNNGQPHESGMFIDVMAEDPVTSPDEVNVPPYHPDVPEIRRSWAHYYDRVSEMDRWVGEMLDELEERGLAENTIVMYFSDHGGVLPRSKRFLYHTGTAVPLVVRAPEKWKHLIPAEPGSTVDQVVSFVDLAATLLSLAGAEIPAHYQGRPFLGEADESADNAAFLYRDRMGYRFDTQRGVFDGRYRYIRNYYPHRSNGQYINYPFRMRSMQAWYHVWQAGEATPEQSRYWLPKPPEELYDTANDPWEVNNLADDLAYAEKLDELRKATRQYILETRDAGFIPEDMFDDLSEGQTLYEYVHSDAYPLERSAEVAGMATVRNPEMIPDLKEAMRDPHPVIRYWGALGCLVLGQDCQSSRPVLEQLLDDPYASVRATAAEAVGNLGAADLAVETLESILSSSDDTELMYALNALAFLDLDERHQELLLNKVQSIAEDDDLSSQRAAMYLVKKWTEAEYPPIF